MYIHYWTDCSQTLPPYLCYLLWTWPSSVWLFAAALNSWRLVFFWKLLCYRHLSLNDLILPVEYFFVDWIAGWCSNLASFELSSPQHQETSLMPVKQAWRMMRMDILYIGPGTYYKNDVLNFYRKIFYFSFQCCFHKMIFTLLYLFHFS